MSILLLAFQVLLPPASFICCGVRIRTKTILPGRICPEYVDLPWGVQSPSSLSKFPSSLEVPCFYDRR
eukprot:12920775-Prorocentrum_lima.AAC.1